jgi:hypothetical protein
MAGPTISIVCTNGHSIIVNAPFIPTLFNILGVAQRSKSHAHMDEIYSCKVCGLHPSNWSEKISSIAQYIGLYDKLGESYRLNVGTGTFASFTFIDSKNASITPSPTDITHATPVTNGSTVSMPTTTLPVPVVNEADLEDEDEKVVEADWVTQDGLKAIQLGAYHSMTYAIHEALMMNFRSSIADGYTGVSITAGSIRKLSKIAGGLAANWGRFRTAYMDHMSKRYKITMIESMDKDVTVDDAKAITLTLISTMHGATP